MKDTFENFREILQYTGTHQIRLNRFWANFVETARFKLGESIKDIKIPFSLSSQATDTLRNGIADFLNLLKKRHEAHLKPREDRSIDDFDRKTRLPPKTFLIRLYRPESLEYRIIRQALETDPLLDCGIFEIWFSAENGGAQLLETLAAIYRKALFEEVKAEHFERTVYITHLALVKHVLQTKSLIKETSIKGIQYEQVDVTFGNLLAIIFAQVMSHEIGELQRKRLASDLTQSVLLLTSTCHPLAFTSIKNAILRSRINPYLIHQDTVDLLDPFYRRVSQEDTDLQFVQQEMMKEIRQASQARESILEEAFLVWVRSSVLKLLCETDNPTFSLFQVLRDLIADPNRLFDLLADSTRLEELIEQIKAVTPNELREESRLKQLQDLENMLRMFQKKTLFKKKESVESLIAKTVRAYLNYKIDLYLDRFTQEAIHLVDNRQSKMDVTQLKKDYEVGRLYRISADPSPTLQQFSERFEGQLFIDLKDFTKRTHYAKEIVMADFLGTEFYKPILDASRKYASSMEDPEKSLQLINLLGDAVIFSGNIEALVNLAQDIQALFREYRTKLKASSPGNLERELREPVEEAYKRNLSQIQVALDRNRTRLEQSRKDIFSKIKSNFNQYAKEFPPLLGNEIAKLETEFLEWDTRIQNEENADQRYEFITQRNQLSQRIVSLRGIQKQYVGQFQIMTPDQQLLLLARFFFRDALADIRHLEESIESLHKSRNALQVEFERDIKKIEGFGMEAGLFISFGSASETIQIRDDTWGDQRVSIAETINEAARGTARNQVIKRLLDGRLSEQIRLRNKPDLCYPFQVYVEKTFSFQMTPQQSATFQNALKNRNYTQAEQVLTNLHYQGLQDLRDQIEIAQAHPEQATLTGFADIYNEGEAISEEAVHAFLRETSTHRLHFRKAFPVRRFHPQILERFLFLSEMCQLILSVDQERTTQTPLIFRQAGHVTFRGFESHGEIGVYEILRHDSPFYQLLVQHHFADWLKECDAKKD